MRELLLNISGLETQFKTPNGIAHAVNGISFGVKEEMYFAVAGQSG